MMELTTKDIGKYYLVCDDCKKDVKLVAKFVSDFKQPNIYRYRMYILTGPYEGILVTSRQVSVEKELTGSEVLAMML